MAVKTTDIQLNGLCRKMNHICRNIIPDFYNLKSICRAKNLLYTAYILWRVVPTQKQSIPRAEVSPLLTFIQEKHIIISSSGFCNVTHYRGFPLQEGLWRSTVWKAGLIVSILEYYWPVLLPIHAEAAYSSSNGRFTVRGSLYFDIQALLLYFYTHTFNNCCI